MARRIKHTEDHESHERWLVSYADFITLLFAFFVVLYATSSANEQKQKEFESSVKKYFLGAVGASGGSSEGSGNKDHKNYNSIIQSPIHKFNNVKDSLASTQKQIEEFIETQISQSDSKKYIKDIDSDHRGVRLILEAQKIYAKDSPLFLQEALPLIDRLAQLISHLESAVRIESHLSGKEKLGSYPSYWELSSARSSFLVRYLSKKHDISLDKLIPIGFADSRPWVPQKGSPQNARLEIVFVEQE